jgi:hypothetical protein
MLTRVFATGITFMLALIGTPAAARAEAHTMSCVLEYWKIMS